VVINNAGGLIDASASTASDAIVGAVSTLVDNFGEIKGDIDLGAGNDNVILRDGSTMTGDIDLGDGSDTFQMETGSTFNGTADGGSGGSNIDQLTLLGNDTDTIASTKLVDFERLQKLRSGEWTLTGDIGFTDFVRIDDGVLSVAGTLTSPVVDVSPFAGNGMLAVTGTIVGNVTVFDGGTLAPGRQRTSRIIRRSGINDRLIARVDVTVRGVSRGAGGLKVCRSRWLGRLHSETVV
jgi:hypothetical protein